LFFEFSIIVCMGIKRLSHAVYDTRYHFVWAPKYREWILKDEVRDSVKEMIEWKKKFRKNRPKSEG